MTNAQARDYAIGDIKKGALEPTEEFKEYDEKEKRGEITIDDIKKYPIVYDEDSPKLSPEMMKAFRRGDYTLWQREYFDTMESGEFHDKAVEYANAHPFDGKAVRL